jgi:hypothetical protein
MNAETCFTPKSFLKNDNFFVEEKRMMVTVEKDIQVLFLTVVLLQVLQCIVLLL